MERQSVEQDDQEDYDNETHIEWSNLIFLPFHPIFKLIVLFSVIVKSFMGPIRSVYPIVYCWDSMDHNVYLLLLKYFYQYCCDLIYGLDTFLHIVHRQVTDKAMRREYLPKSALLILIDIVSIIPLFRLVVNNDCPEIHIWPNVLSYVEFLTIYRVFEYYDLLTTHSFWNLLFGFGLCLICTINAINCFWMVLTQHGLCRKCNTGIYDWRITILHKLNETGEAYSTVIYGMAFVMTYTLNEHLDDLRPFTILEIKCVGVFVALGYILVICIILPKLFVEAILRIRRIFTGHPHVRRLIEETKRRNSSSKAHTVEHFYSVMWKKRSGITHIPDIIMELPRYLRVAIRQDLYWPLLYHSPTLRKGSISFKRYICDYVKQDFKLPGEKFFAGPHTHTNIYYLKSGVAQILSGDEGATPVISVTSGTIFGDISFFVPPLKRKVIARCLTYCEVMFLSRHDYITALHKYPEDRRQVLQLAKEKLRHAKTLYNCKQLVRGLDRAEDEGIAWVKRRWWEIADYIANWKRKTRKDIARCELPPEETVYHCAKYIGQLVLCSDAQLLTKSLFANVNFPWLLVPHSVFIMIWFNIVCVTVFCVLVVYPPNITKPEISTWFRFFQVWTDLIYICDICVALVTLPTEEESLHSNFASVMFARFKTLGFNLDLLSTIWIEYIAIIIGKPQFYNVAQFNRLIKVYMLFTGEYIQWNIKKNPMIRVFFKVVMTQFCYFYISIYIIYTLATHMPGVSMSFFFGNAYCEYAHVHIENCDPGKAHVLQVCVSRIMEYIFFQDEMPRTLIDIYIAAVFSTMAYMISMYCKSCVVAALFLKFREVTNYQSFVSNLKKYYKYYKIHHDLLKRLDRYLECHWKYYQGADIMHAHILKNEPYDIYWKVQGEVAEKIIGNSQLFMGADPALIRDLAYVAKFLILPKSSTLFLFGVQCKNVTWIVQGHVKCEYHNENGELLKVYYDPGVMLSMSSVFLGKASLRTYSACTDCEILYIKRQDFFKIIKQYPNEWSHLDRCLAEFGPIFDEMFHSYVKKHRDYQKKLRDRIFHARRSTIGVSLSYKKSLTDNIENRPNLKLERDFWTEPESDFIQYWLFFRMIIVVVSIINSAMQGGIGVMYRRRLIMISAFCDCIAWMDMVLKLFVSIYLGTTAKFYLAYYDHRGILIFDKRLCVANYLTRGFCLDLIGALPWYEVIRLMMSDTIEEDEAMLINTWCKFAHIYILIGYFDYISDVPTVNVAYTMILKWQLVAILLMFGTSHLLMSYCVDFDFNKNGDLVEMWPRNTCWLPKFFGMEINLTKAYTEEDLHILFADSLFLAQCGLMGSNFGRFQISREKNNIIIGAFLMVLLLVFWYVMAYSLTLLVLNSRGNTLFQHGVSQLKKFLTAERLDKTLVEKAAAHFTYWWMRTRGINIQHLSNERIGVVFRQDLTYYFFKKTFLALDTLLQGGENLGRQLASASTQLYILPSHEVIREMDLTSWVFVVHRGKVVISKNGERVATLGKGSLFGQLTGELPRPVRISAMSEGFADLLQININVFQEIISDDIRDIIDRNSQSKSDYMSTKKHFTEDPYDTIQYILRGRKTIQLPWMFDPIEARHGSWYSRWLYLTWLVEPFISALIVLALKSLESHIVSYCYLILSMCDIIHLGNILSEFFTVELVVVDKNCVFRKVSYRKLKRVGFYFDIVTLIVPLVTYFTRNVNYQLIRLLRLRHLYNFHHHFCMRFKSYYSPIILKFVIVFLLWHSMSCGWVTIACRNKLPGSVTNLTSHEQYRIDSDEWAFPNERQGGCYRLISQVHLNDSTENAIFVVPRKWHNDYVVGMVYVLLIFTHVSSQRIVSLTISQIYYNIFISFVIYMIDVWLVSATISYIYTRFRELYQYDYNVSNLAKYLRYCGLSPALLNAMEKYTKQLWKRQKGNWLPELAHQAPMCLREDLLSALYMHHLDTPPLFRDLPHYFKRQVAARLKRIVIFPGKSIIQEGDIFACMYFIHEGDVEKWYFDHRSGEHKLMSLLTTNGFFGQIPGIFPNIPFQFSYYARTVVDMVYLRLNDWKDLIDGYPLIKTEIYSSAKQLKKDFGNLNRKT